MSQPWGSSEACGCPTELLHVPHRGAIHSTQTPEHVSVLEVSAEVREILGRLSSSVPSRQLQPHLGIYCAGMSPQTLPSLKGN